MTPLSNIEFFLSRRTVRNFSDRPVDDSMLTEMIEAAAHAPNTGNMQLYSVIATTSEEGRRRLAPAHFSQPASTGAPLLLTFCADFNRFEKWCRSGDAIPGYDNFQSFIWAVIDTAIFAQQFSTVAEMNGLGCCYLGTTTYNAPQIAEALSLPDRVVPVVTLTVGYPSGDAPVSDRLPVGSILHHERYSDYSDAQIGNAYRFKESLPESVRFVEENGKKSLAQVFTDVRYTRESNEYFSKLYADFIESRGFRLP